MNRDVMLLQYPEWHKKPFRLTVNEMEKPLSVIEEFFEDFELPDLRSILDTWVNKIISSKVTDPLKYVWFREDLERCLEACFLLSTNQDVHVIQDNKGAGPIEQDFLGMLAHEIRGQLSGIIQSLEIIEEHKSQHTGQYAAEADTYLNYARLVTTNALEVLDNMLTTTKSYKNMLSMEIIEKPFDISQFVHSCIAPFEIFKKVLQKTITLNINANANHYGVTDVVKLRQVIHNLLHNAFKYSVPNGIIKLEADLIDTTLHISISSKGPFLPADKVKIIFEPYQTWDKSKAGMGLGLYICKLYTELLNGKIEAASYPGGITTFTVTIPVNKKNAT